ncbi:MAG TPA: hypothetical protein VMW42_07340 [Desulfatiglandales bacterium]|nr:hypothetical protein [Desulfatiglandales bacterium]
MKGFKCVFLTVLILALMVWVSAYEVSARQALSKKIAPDVPAEISETLAANADVYLTGGGGKEVLFIADPFCPNSRKTYSLLLSRLEYIRTVKVVLVCSLPHTGSDVLAALVMRMHSAGKGQLALETTFKLEVPQTSDRDAARQMALELFKRAFPDELGAVDFKAIMPELDVVKRNTNLAKEIDYTGTPHLIVGGRVLHGYSDRAIDILLKNDF